MSPAIPTRAVDCHAHVFSADAPAIAGARYRPGYAATLEAWRTQWRRAGVTHGVIVQPSFFGTNNAEMLAALARDREHLRGVAVVAPEIPDEELEAMHANGVRAIRLNLRGVRDYSAFAAPSWSALFERVAKLHWHLETFVEEGRAPELAKVLAPAPADVAFDHFANPGSDARATLDALRTLARDRNVYVKLSGAYRIGDASPRELARRWVDALGPDRIVWGSDWPWTLHESGRDYVRLRRDLDDWAGAELAPGVLWDNASRLHGFD